MKAKLLSLFIFMVISCMESAAQFTMRPSVNDSKSLTIDSVRVKGSDVVTPEDLRTYGYAYKEYEKRELAKFRNKINFRSTLGVTQTSFNNWAAGGDDSFSGRLWVNFTHTYTNEETLFNVKSVFDGAYKITMTDKIARKSEDYFTITSTPGWKLTDNLEATGSMVLRSQFANGYVAPGDTILTSAFFAPAILNLSMGITYIPVKDFPLSLYVAPISGNGTFVLNKELADKGAHGVEKGHYSKTNFGAFSRLSYADDFFDKSLILSVKVESFWDYSSCPTLLWESLFTYKLSSLFSIDLYFKVLYDESIKTPEIAVNNFWQVNQSLGFNFGFNFASEPNGDKPSFLDRSYVVGR